MALHGAPMRSNSLTHNRGKNKCLFSEFLTAPSPCTGKVTGTFIHPLSVAIFQGTRCAQCSAWGSRCPYPTFQTMPGSCSALAPRGAGLCPGGGCKPREQKPGQPPSLGSALPLTWAVHLFSQFPSLLHTWNYFKFRCFQEWKAQNMTQTCKLESTSQKALGDWCSSAECK